MNEEVVETYQRKFAISKTVLKEGKAGLGAERTSGSGAHACNLGTSETGVGAI